MKKNLCKILLSENGTITPLLIPSADTGGTGLMNPSVFNDDDNLILNLRHVNYTLYHCENGQLFNNRYGPLSYLNPENDVKLRTWNYLCTLDNDLTIKDYKKIDTSKFDIEPVWEFIGLEDARLFRWNKKLWHCGVRRDVKPDGEGRMEMSELLVDDNYCREIKRSRIAPPQDPNSYCEKNWMPVLDMPFHFVKWTNPTEVVKIDVNKATSQTVFISHDIVGGIGDLRGSSQVITIGNYRMCIVHEVALWKNKLQQKDAKYTHRFVVWDKEWNIVKISDQFSFMDGEIEFCCGMAIHQNNLLITFGFQDNAAFILKGSIKFFEKFIGIKLQDDQSKFGDFKPVYCLSFEDHTERVDEMKKQFEECGIKNYKVIVSTKDSDSKNIVRGKYLDALSPVSVNIAISHLKAIKKWYKESKSPYVIIMEDDVSLKTSEFWSFTWAEFMDCLPPDWDCIQLGCIVDNTLKVRLTRRKGDIWSAMAYMITRSYAKRLLDAYCRNDEFVLELENKDIQPHIENLIYVPGITYSIPLLIENADFNSTIDDRVNIDKHKSMHAKSSEFVYSWWKNNGLITKLEDLI
jgi:hypothetical protein